MLDHTLFTEVPDHLEPGDIVFRPAMDLLNNADYWFAKVVDVSGRIALVDWILVKGSRTDYSFSELRVEPALLREIRNAI